jgi:hypothetical protein
VREFGVLYAAIIAGSIAGSAAKCVFTGIGIYFTK